MGRKVFHCNFSPKEFSDSHSRLRYLYIEGIDQYFVSKLRIFLKDLDNGEEKKISKAPYAYDYTVHNTISKLYSNN